MCGGLGTSLALLGVLALALPLLAGGGGLGPFAFRRGRGGARAESALALLDRRLALGEIGPEDYFERESALRSSNQPSRPRRPWS